MFSDFRFRRVGVSWYALAVTFLIAILFVTGCASSGNSEAQLAVSTLSAGLPAGSVSVGGGSYPSTALKATGGTAPYTWALSTGSSLPPGLTLNASGTISGSPTTAGAYNFSVTVTDSATPTAHTATGSLSITINAALSVTTSGTLPATGEAGSSYSGTLAEAGGVGPFTWVVSSGALPGGLSLGNSGAITGTISPSATPGTFNFIAKVTDSQGNNTVSGSISIKVDAALTVTPPTLSLGIVGVSYTSPAFAAAGGSGNGYTFAVASGSLPGNLAISPSTGVISGTPSTAGNFTFAVKVTDSLGFSATTGNLSVTINAALAITPPTFPTGILAASYAAQTFTASGGSGTGYTYSLASGSLPAPLALGASGTIASATPTASGTFTFAVKVTDSLGDTATSGSLSITIDPALVITAPAFPTGIVGSSYAAKTFTSAGGSGTGYTYTLASGSLPAPLTLGANGTIASATPTASGTFTFTVKVTDSHGFSTTSSSLSLTIDPALVITPPTFPTGIVGISYPAETFTTTGGSGTGYTYSLASGSLPAPLTLGANGTIASGVPATAGTSTFAVKVTDSLGNTATTSTLTITVNGALAITPPTFPTGIVGASYSAETFTASGGSGTGYTFSLTSGSLPAPLTVGANGTIASATPTASGTFTFTVKVTDSLSDTATSSSLSITIDPALVITPPTFPTGIVGVSYPLQTFTASGGSGTGYTYALTSGSLPAPLTLGANGTIASATPTASGTFTLTVKVTDSLGFTTTSSSLSIKVNPALAITPPTFPSGVVGVSYPAETFTASGGSGTGYTFALASGSLPNPLTLAANGTIASAAPTANGTSTFTVRVTDSLGNTATTGTLTITINLSLAITPPSFPTGIIGASYPSETFTATGGSGTGYTYTLASGSLPAPLALGANGTIASATPTASGTFTFAVKVTDSLGNTATTGSLSITIDPALIITPPSFPVGVINGSYPAETFTATGGSGAGYTFALASGSLPAPLSLGANGTIASATPTATGTSTFTVRVTDSLGNTATTSTLSITINGALAITSPSFPTGVVGASYPSKTFTASGGSGTGYTFAIVSGSLPSPLSMGTNGTIVSAVPTVSGTFTFTVRVTDSLSDTATTTSLSITIDPALVITPPTFPTGTLGTSYPAETFTATGGSGSGYTYSLASGSLPAPLTLGANGTIASATPTASGTFTFTVKVTDSLGFTMTTGSLSITITGPSCTSCTISGTVSGPWVSNVTVALSGSATATTTTNASGQYSFSGLAADGTYTVTPTLAGYSYSPSAPVIFLNSDTTQNFTATSNLTSYSISGTITYAGSKAGNTIIRVYQSNCNGGCGVVAGASFPTAPTSGGTSYIIQGLPSTNGGPSGYYVQAEIDTQATGITNESDPEGTSSTVTLPNSNATGVNFAIVDRTPSAPVMPPQNQFHVSPADQTAVLSYSAPLDGNGEEIATSYNVYYSTNNFATTLGPVNFKAQGNNVNVFILGGTLATLTNGVTYQFKMSAVNSTGESAKTAAVSATIGAVTGNFTVSGTVTYPSLTAVGPLYVGVYGNSGIFVDVISSPPANGTSGVPFTITGIPAGTYQNFAIIDVNKDGEIDIGDLQNVCNHCNTPTINVSGSMSGQSLTLTSFTATPAIPTSVSGSSSQANSYSLQPQITAGTKLPVSMTLFSGNNVAVPYNMNADQHDSSYSPVYTNSTQPNVGDQYQFLVTFSDGSTAVMSAPVTAVLAFPQSLQTSGSATVPVLSWAAPSPLPTITPYTYSVNLNSTNNSFPENWNYFGPNNGNGIPSTQTSVTYNTDGSASPNSPLVAGVTYSWSVAVQDNDNNIAQYAASYTVPGGVGPATQLVFTEEPSNATTGSTVPNVQVSVEDGSGNVVTSSSASITIAINNNPASGSLSGNTTIAATSGVATFSNLSINNAGNGYTLSATSSGLSTATSNAFDVFAPGQLQISVPSLPSGTVSTPYATANFVASGGTGTGYTWSVSSGSLPASVTLDTTTGSSVYLSGIPSSPATSNFTLQVTDSGSNTATTNTLSITMNSPVSCPMTQLGNESLLNGTYVSLFNGFVDANGPSESAGVFVANGSGGITGGEFDFGTVLNYSGGQYLAPVAPAKLTIVSSGSCYQLGSDGRGTMVLNVGGVDKVTYAFSVRGDGALGRFIEFDDANPNTNATVGRGAGVFQKQAVAGPFSLGNLSGPFAFGLTGFNNDNCKGGTTCGTSGDLGYQRIGVVGVVTFNGTGGGSAGTFDVAQVNGGGTPAQQNLDGVVVSTVTYTAPDTFGRGTVSFSGTNATLGGSFQVDFAYYLIASGQAYLQSIDSPSNDPLFNGEAIEQTGSFSAASLNGNSFFSATGGDIALNSYSVIEAGVVTGSGTGSSVSTLMDKISNGTTVSTGTTAITGGTFAASSNGIGVLTIGTGGAAQPYSVAMYNTNAGFLLEGTQASPGANVITGLMQPQVTPGGGFGNSSVSGLFIDGNAFPSDTYAKVSAGSLTLTSGSPTGTASGTSDASQGLSCGGSCLQSNGSISGTYSIDSNGRITVNTQDTVFGWLLGTSHGVLLSTGNNGLTIQLDQ